MTMNVGKIDRYARIIIGLILLYAALLSGMVLFAGTLAKIIAIVVAVVLLATSAKRMCPLYSMLGINTCQS